MVSTPGAAQTNADHGLGEPPPTTIIDRAKLRLLAALLLSDPELVPIYRNALIAKLGNPRNPQARAISLAQARGELNQDPVGLVNEDPVLTRDPRDPYFRIVRAKEAARRAGAPYLLVYASLLEHQSTGAAWKTAQLARLARETAVLAANLDWKEAATSGDDPDVEALRLALDESRWAFAAYGDGTNVLGARRNAQVVDRVAPPLGTPIAVDTPMVGDVGRGYGWQYATLSDEDKAHILYWLDRGRSSFGSLRKGQRVFLPGGAESPIGPLLGYLQAMAGAEIYATDHDPRREVRQPASMVRMEEELAAVEPLMEQFARHRSYETLVADPQFLELPQEHQKWVSTAKFMSDHSGIPIDFANVQRLIRYGNESVYEQDPESHDAIVMLYVAPASIHNDPDKGKEGLYTGMASVKPGGEEFWADTAGSPGWEALQVHKGGAVKSVRKHSALFESWEFGVLNSFLGMDLLFATVASPDTTATSADHGGVRHDREGFTAGFGRRPRNLPSLDFLQGLRLGVDPERIGGQEAQRRAAIARRELLRNGAGQGKEVLIRSAGGPGDSGKRMIIR